MAPPMFTDTFLHLPREGNAVVDTFVGYWFLPCYFTYRKLTIYYRTYAMVPGLTRGGYTML